MRIVVLDLIRFAAALSVVLYHYISVAKSPSLQSVDEFTKFGYLGVPLFFMISGYVIALSANERTAIQFAISRFVRLYPALWVGVLFTVAVSTIYTDNEYSFFQVITNFTLLNDYIGYKDVDGVYWTLKEELKFYACVFILIFCGLYPKFKLWLSVWLLLVVLYTFTGQPFFLGWFISPAYSSFFIAGISLYLIQCRKHTVFSYVVLALSLALSSFFSYEHTEDFMKNPGFYEKLIAVGLVWGFYGFLYMLAVGRLSVSANNIFISLGALTYPLYLIHNAAGKALITYYDGVVPEVILITLVILFMIASSWCIHVYFEKKIASPLKNYLLKIFP